MQFSTCAEGLQQCTDLRVCSNSSGICTKRSWFCCRVGVFHGFRAPAGLKQVCLTPPRQWLLRWSFPRPQPSNCLVNWGSELMILQKSLRWMVWLTRAAVWIICRGGGTQKFSKVLLRQWNSLDTFLYLCVPKCCQRHQLVHHSVTGATRRLKAVQHVSALPVPNTPIFYSCGRPELVIFLVLDMSPYGLWFVECVYMTGSS